jgi:hypothetical protein
MLIKSETEDKIRMKTKIESDLLDIRPTIHSKKSIFGSLI